MVEYDEFLHGPGGEVELERLSTGSSAGTVEEEEVEKK